MTEVHESLAGSKDTCSADLCLSERLAQYYGALFNDAPDDEITTSLREGLTSEIQALVVRSGLTDVPMPEVTEADLVEYFDCYGDLAQVTLELAADAHIPRVIHVNNPTVERL